MSIRLRRFLYLTVFLTFFVAGPLITLYASGYRVNPDSLRVQQVGAFYIKSYPSGAEVLLDGKSYGKTTPARFLNVSPGFHTITIQKEGFAPWQKELEVTSSQTTFVRDAVLFIERPEAIRVDTGGTTPITNRSGSISAYMSSPTTIQIFNIETGNTFTINTPVKIDRLEQFSQSSERILAIAGSDIVVVNINTERTVSIGASTDTVARAFWSPNEDAVYVITESKLLLQLEDGDFSTVHDSILDAQSVANGIIELQDHEDGSRILRFSRTDTDSFEVPIVSSSSTPTIETLPSDRYLLIKDGEVIHVLDLETQLLTRLNGSEYDWHDNKLVYSTPTETNYLFLTTGLSDLLDRTSDPISLVRWHTSGSYIARVRGETIELIEIDGRGMRNVVVIAENKKPVDIFFGPRGERLYLLTENELEQYDIQ